MSGTRASLGAQAQVAALSETVASLQQELEALASQRNTRSAEIHRTELATADTRIATKELEGITNTHTQATAQVGLWRLCASRADAGSDLCRVV